jgi:hypothetical protein
MLPSFLPAPETQAPTSSLRETLGRRVLTQAPRAAVTAAMGVMPDAVTQPHVGWMSPWCRRRCRWWAWSFSPRSTASRASPKDCRSPSASRIRAPNFPGSPPPSGLAMRRTLWSCLLLGSSTRRVARRSSSHNCSWCPFPEASRPTHAWWCAGREASSAMTAVCAQGLPASAVPTPHAATVEMAPRAKVIVTVPGHLSAWAFQASWRGGAPFPAWVAWTVFPPPRAACRNVPTTRPARVKWRRTSA